MSYIDKSELLKSALTLPTKNKSRSIINKYRDTVIVLKLKGYTVKEIREYLLLNDVEVGEKNLYAYLKKYPITSEEENNYMKLINNKKESNL
jgi:hypothetical protein